MAIVSLRQLLDHAAENGYGVPAFNVNNLEQVQAIMSAAQEVGAPVIMQASAGARRYTGELFLKSLIQAAVETYPDVPVCMHQDHGQNPAVCQGAIRMGFSSVMMDGSLQADGKTIASYDYNVNVTRQVVDMAHCIGVSVEGELGCLGSLETMKGDKEDGHGTDAKMTRDQLLTDPDQAADFVEKTQLDALAIAIGTLCIISGLFLLMHRKRNRQMKQARQAQAKLQQQLEQEQQRQESLQQLKDELTEKIKQEEVRAMERHRQECISRLREACIKAECYPTLSPRYKAALLSAYDQVLHWNDTKQFLTCIDRDFNRFAHRIETQYLKRRSSNHATARLCTLLLLDAPEEYIKALMPYTAETYHKAMTRLYKRFDTFDREGLLVHLLYVLVEGM